MKTSQLERLTVEFVATRQEAEKLNVGDCACRDVIGADGTHLFVIAQKLSNSTSIIALPPSHVKQAVAAMSEFLSAHDPNNRN